MVPSTGSSYAHNKGCKVCCDDWFGRPETAESRRDLDCRGHVRKALRIELYADRDTGVIET